jgi:hypothetical protein
MTPERPGLLRITATRFELLASTPTGSIVQVSLDINPDTAHILRHLVATRVDADTGARRRCAASRSLLARALEAVGSAPERVEVLADGDGRPHFALVMTCADGCVRRIDLDLLDTAELIVARRLPVVAVGWPEHDWDGALRALTVGD